MPIFKTASSKFKKSNSSLSSFSSFSRNHEHLLLTLLQKNQSNRKPCQQIHSHLITSSVHTSKVNQTSINIWNTLLKHYTNGHIPQESIYLYKQILNSCTPNIPFDTYTFSFLLKACANVSNICVSRQFHCASIKIGFCLHIYVDTSLVNAYATCGVLTDAKKLFDEMSERNSVSWNAMITGFTKWGDLENAKLLFSQMPNPNVVTWTTLIDGYTRNNDTEQALLLFRQMCKEGVAPNGITVLAIVPTIFNYGSLHLGETLHAYCEKRGLITLDVRVENSLIDMYAKCGSIEASKKVFDLMQERRNLLSWTSIITGFAKHGKVEEAMNFFDEMQKANICPNHVTFLGILNACSHSGLVDEGLHIFWRMIKDYNINPDIKHYGCIIDMFGRGGRLKEAEELILEMPMKVNVIVWRTLLGCCSKYREREMGERVMRRIVELEKAHGGDFVVLSNMYTEVGMFHAAERVRKLIDEKDLTKVSGHSFVRSRV